MRILFTCSLCILALFFAYESVDVLAAEQTRNIKMGILNVESVKRNSLMAKDIARQIDAKRRKFRNEIKKEEKSLRTANDELQKQRVILSPEAYSEELRKFRAQNVALQKKVRQRNQELNHLRSVATRELNKAIESALKEISRRGRYNLVLRYSPQIILVRPDYLDISKFVLDELNKTVKKYTIPAVPNKAGK
jgi:Skp family chaperone for outer membrane proteins